MAAIGVVVGGGGKSLFSENPMDLFYRILEKKGRLDLILSQRLGLGVDTLTEPQLGSIAKDVKRLEGFIADGKINLNQDALLKLELVKRSLASVQAQIKRALKAARA